MSRTAAAANLHLFWEIWLMIITPCYDPQSVSCTENQWKFLYSNVRELKERNIRSFSHSSDRYYALHVACTEYPPILRGTFTRSIIERGRQYCHAEDQVMLLQEGPGGHTRAQEAAIKWWESRPAGEWWGVRTWQRRGGRQGEHSPRQYSGGGTF